jgi:hypothetical protein
VTIAGAADRCALLGAAAAFVLLSAKASGADDTSLSDLPKSWAAVANDAAIGTTRDPQPDAQEKIEASKSYSIPALEVAGFALLLNQVNRHTDGSDYDSNWSTIRRNLHSSWVVDSDPFRTNQLGHPYQGSMYFGFARSAGLDYWTALGFSVAGSALWEIAGEATPPSRHDLINTGIGGSFLGEVLFRLSNLVLEHENIPPFWRELGAAVVSPPTGFNRLVFGDRFKTLFPSNDPVY